MKKDAVAIIIPEGLTGRMLRKIKGEAKLSDIFPVLKLIKCK